MKFPFEKKNVLLKETKFLAEEFSKIITCSSIIILNGNLGAGKTTLVKLICSNYGIEEVNSPSFSIVNEYSGKYKVYHFDFYRLKKIEELYDIGFEDYLNDTSAIVFVEWGNLMPEILPKNYYNIQMELKENNSRNIQITKKN